MNRENENEEKTPDGKNNTLLQKIVTRSTSFFEPNPERQIGSGLTSHHVYAIISAALGAGFQHGYNSGVVNAPMPIIQTFFRETIKRRSGSDPSSETIAFMVGTTVGIFSLGGMVGSLVSVHVLDMLGCKGGLLCNNALAILAAILQGFAKIAWSYEMLIIGRLIIGINCGLAASLTPMYLTEISPVASRGAVGSIYQLVITITILISQIFGLPQILGNDEDWPWLFAIIFFPAVLMLITYIHCPESPKYLLMKGKEEEAEQAIKWFERSDKINKEIEDLRRQIHVQRDMPKVTPMELWTNKMLRKPFIISIVIMVSQQFSGINVAINYSTEIFKQAGLDSDAAVYMTIVMGLVNVLTTVVSVMLVEKAGRKTLYIVGLSGMAVLFLILTISLNLKGVVNGAHYVSAACIIGSVMMFAIGPGSIPWFLVSEIFAHNARSLATGIAVCINWMGNFIISFGFPPVSDLLGSYVFLIFVVLLVIFCLYTYLQVPETKGRTIEEITQGFRDNAKETH